MPSTLTPCTQHMSADLNLVLLIGEPYDNTKAFTQRGTICVCSFLPKIHLFTGTISFGSRNNVLLNWFIFFSCKTLLEIRASKMIEIVSGSCFPDIGGKWHLCLCVDAALRRVSEQHCQCWPQQRSAEGGAIPWLQLRWIPETVSWWGGCSRAVEWMEKALVMKSESLGLNFNSPTYYWYDFGQFS